MKGQGRDWHAVSAILRRAPFFKDRRAPRGGARNSSRDLIEEGTQDLLDTLIDGKVAEADLAESEEPHGEE